MATGGDRKVPPLQDIRARFGALPAGSIGRGSAAADSPEAVAVLEALHAALKGKIGSKLKLKRMPRFKLRKCALLPGHHILNAVH